MATTIDSYAETNQDVANNMYAGDGWFYFGQSFNNANAIILDSCKFFLSRIGNPTGNLYAKIYAHSGTYGTSSVPTGSALATSDAIDATTLGIFSSWSLHTFTFSGANRISLTGGDTKYCVVLFFDSTFSNDSNKVLAGGDNTAPTHGGNLIYGDDGSTWNADSTDDLCFYVYGVNAYSMAAAVGSFILTGNNATLTVLRGITAGSGSFVLTGKDATLSAALTEALASGSYALTGYSVSFEKITYFGVQSKNTATMSATAKNSATMTVLTKNAATMTPQSKNTATMTPQSKNSEEWTPLDKS